MSNYQQAKQTALNYFEALESAGPDTVSDVIEDFTGDHYLWRGVYPFREQHGGRAAAEVFWKPFMQAVGHIQRRQDIFIAGNNELGGEQWVMSMGHFMGLFDREWLGIRPTGKMINLR